MWKWVCPKTPNLVWEFHSFAALDNDLLLHESGWKVGEVITLPCPEIHEYWDDGKSCNYPGCNIKYVPDFNGDYFVD